MYILVFMLLYGRKHFIFLMQSNCLITPDYLRYCCLIFFPQILQLSRAT